MRPSPRPVVDRLISALRAARFRLSAGPTTAVVIGAIAAGRLQSSFGLHNAGAAVLGTSALLSPGHAVIGWIALAVSTAGRYPGWAQTLASAGLVIGVVASSRLSRSRYPVFAVGWTVLVVSTAVSAAFDYRHLATHGLLEGILPAGAVGFGLCWAWGRWLGMWLDRTPPATVSDGAAWAVVAALSAAAAVPESWLVPTYLGIAAGMARAWTRAGAWQAAGLAALLAGIAQACGLLTAEVALMVLTVGVAAGLGSAARPWSALGYLLVVPLLTRMVVGTAALPGVAVETAAVAVGWLVVGGVMAELSRRRPQLVPAPSVRPAGSRSQAAVIGETAELISGLASWWPMTSELISAAVDGMCQGCPRHRKRCLPVYGRAGKSQGRSSADRVAAIAASIPEDCDRAERLRQGMEVAGRVIARWEQLSEDRRREWGRVVADLQDVAAAVVQGTVGGHERLRFAVDVATCPPDDVALVWRESPSRKTVIGMAESGHRQPPASLGTIATMAEAGLAPESISRAINGRGGPRVEVVAVDRHSGDVTIIHIGWTTIAVIGRGRMEVLSGGDGICPAVIRRKLDGDDAVLMVEGSSSKVRQAVGRAAGARGLRSRTARELADCLDSYCRRSADDPPVRIAAVRISAIRI